METTRGSCLNFDLKPVQQCKNHTSLVFMHKCIYFEFLLQVEALLATYKERNSAGYDTKKHV